MNKVSSFTFAMIKPHIVREKKIGEVISFIENAGFVIKKMSSEKLELEEAQSFYEVHEGKPFYKVLCKELSSGDVIVMILEKKDSKDVVSDFRKLLGNTDPAKAEEGTLRKKFGKNLDFNAVHGSDSIDTAEEESEFFFGYEDEDYDDVEDDFEIENDKNCKKGKCC